MDEFLQVGELRDEVRRLLRYRTPLILAVLVNCLFLTRVPITRMWAEFAPSLGTETTVLAVAEPTTRPQTLPRYPLVQAVSQEIDILPSGSAAPSPTAAPAARQSPTPTSLSPFAFTNSCGPAVQRLVTHWSAPSQQTDPPANGGQAVEPVSIPDTMAVAKPPAVSNTGTSPLAHRDESPPPFPPIVAESLLTGLTIRNALENEEPVSFLVNGRVCELRPGEAHEFAADTSWTVQFHRGGSFGNAKQTLTPGDYRFVVTDQGWDLGANR
jgi:hypothetical protein